MPIEHLSDIPQGCGPKWFLGLLLPTALAAYGIRVLWQGQITLGGRTSRSFTFTGGDAIAWGILFLAGASALHVVYFWGNSRRLSQYTELAFVVAAGVMGLSLLRILYGAIVW
jgi:hypothetical protein